MLDLGIWSRHMSDKFSGVPDRYCGLGRWIEFKSLEYARGKVPVGAGLSVEQRNVCTDLLKAGDDVRYCALITAGTEQYMIWLPMGEALFPEGHWDVREHGIKYDGKATVRSLFPRGRWK